MRARAKCHPGVHGNAKTSRRGWIVAPLRDEKESGAHANRFQASTRDSYPVTRLLRFGARRPGRELPLHPHGAGIFRKERAQAAAAAGEIALGDAVRSAIQQFGDHLILFRLPAFEVQREHGLSMKLQGIFADTTTPFDHKGEIYKVKVQHNVEKWNR